MTFDRPWVLFFALLPLAWFVWERRRTSRHLGLGLKAGAFLSLVIALSAPRISWPESRVALAVLVDTSASVPKEDLQRASQLAQSINKERGRNWMQVIPFARSTRMLDAANSKDFRIIPASGESARGTDLESAIQDAISAFPSGRNPRIALVSDGRENEGNILRAAWQARRLGIPIDTYLLSGRPKPDLRLESVQIPANVFAGEPFSVNLEVAAPRAMSARVELTAEGKVVGSIPAALSAGVNSLRVKASLNATGLAELGILIRGEGSGEVSYHQSITLRRPKALYITGDSRFLDTHLPDALKAAQFDVMRIEEFERGEFAKLDFSPYQLVIFNNWELDKVPAPVKDRLETFVKEGGGLLVVGGERNIYPETKKAEDSLERVLPAKLLPPRTSEGRAVILVMDRSTSMLGPKIEFARIAAAGIVSNLRPIDIVGVLVFDTTFLWQVPVRLADDRDGINWLISSITPNGGTRIPQALAEGYRAILETPAIYKHMLLLTDGLSDEGNSMNLAKEAQNNAITISAVGLGRDVNRRYLQRLATTAGGKSYFVDDPSELEQIVISDVMEHTGSTSVENLLTPKVVRRAEVLEGVGMESAPALKGYIRYETKPSAETILRADGTDPLLARWQYGLGRAAVFTSDAKPRWATDWIGWAGYDKFWANIARDLLPHREDREAMLRHDKTTGDLIASYRVPEPGRAPEGTRATAQSSPPQDAANKKPQAQSKKSAVDSVPAIYVLGDRKFQQTMTVHRVGAGQYEGRVHIGDRDGFFRVRPLEDSPVFPELVIYRPEPELSDWGADETLMRRVAQYTGGRFQPDPKAAFENEGRSVSSSLELWPMLLALGMALSVTELVIRKWRGLRWSK
jgi:Ca-activated chloride channel homolog